MDILETIAACSLYLGHMSSRWPPHPYIVKALQKSASPEPVGRFP